MQANTPLERTKAQLTMVTGFLVLYFIFKEPVLLYIALGVGLVSLVIPIAGQGIVWLWFKLAQALGWINSRILLSVVYAVILLPISLLYKVQQKDALYLKNKQRDSIWKERNHTYESKDLDNIW